MARGIAKGGHYHGYLSPMRRASTRRSRRLARRHEARTCVAPLRRSPAGADRMDPLVRWGEGITQTKAEQAGAPCAKWGKVHGPRGNQETAGAEAVVAGSGQSGTA